MKKNVEKILFIAIFLVILISLAGFIVYTSFSFNKENFVQQSSNLDYSTISKYDPKILLAIHDTNSIKDNSKIWKDISNHQDKAYFQTHKYQDIIDRDFSFAEIPTFQSIQSSSYILTGIKLLNSVIYGPQCDDLSIDLFNQFSISFSLALQSFKNVNYNFLEIYGNTQSGLLFGLGLNGQQVTITFGNNKPVTFDKSQLKVGVFQVLSFVFDNTKKEVYLYINENQVSKQTYDLSKMSIDQNLLDSKSIEIFSNRQIEINPSKQLDILIDTFILFSKTIDPSVVYQLIEKQQIQQSISSKPVTDNADTSSINTESKQSVCPFNQTDSSLLPCKSKSCSSVNWSKNGFLMDNTMPIECVKEIYNYCVDSKTSDPACQCLKVENINSSQCKNQRDLYTYIVNYDKIANQTRPVNFSGNKFLQNQCDKNPFDRLCAGLKNQQSQNNVSTTKASTTTSASTTSKPSTTSTTPSTTTTSSTTTAPSTTTNKTPATASTTTTTTKKKCGDVQSDDTRLIQLPNTQKLNTYLSS